MLLEKGNLGAHRRERVCCSRKATWGLEEEADEGFKYRSNRSIQRTQFITLDERIVGDVGIAGVTIH
jgi:hypothetical protein